jgi:hypothetical protein
MAPIKSSYKLSWILISIHTVLILVVIGLSFLPSQNPDSSIGFRPMVLTYYFVDLPVGLAFEKIMRPLDMEIPFSTWVFLELSWFIILGGLYWFCIGAIITRLRDRKRTTEVNG